MSDSIPMDKPIDIDARDIFSGVADIRNMANAKHREADELMRKANEATAMARAYNEAADKLELRVQRLVRTKLDQQS